MGLSLYIHPSPAQGSDMPAEYIVSSAYYLHSLPVQGVESPAEYNLGLLGLLPIHSSITYPITIHSPK
jgi:hypothetical protein